MAAGGLFQTGRLSEIVESVDAVLARRKAAREAEARAPPISGDEAGTPASQAGGEHVDVLSRHDRMGRDPQDLNQCLEGRAVQQGYRAAVDPATPNLGAQQAKVLMEHPEFHARWQASQALGELGSEAGFHGADALSHIVVQHDAGFGLKLQATQNISQLGATAGLQGARALAQTLLLRGPSSDPYMRMSAAGSLGKISDAAEGAGAFALAKALVEDNDVCVRRNAASSLGELGAASAGILGAAALAKALKEDSDVNVRWRACEALGKLGPGATGAGLSAFIFALEKDDDMGVRWRSAAGLGAMGVEASELGAAALMKALSGDAAAIVRQHALAAINVLREVVLAVLGQDDRHSYQRGRALWMLAEFGDMVGQTSIEAICAATQDEDKYVRRRAVEALGKLGVRIGGAGTEALTRVANDDNDVYVQTQAADILAKLPWAPKEDEQARMERLSAEYDVWQAAEAARKAEEAAAKEQAMKEKAEAKARAAEKTNLKFKSEAAKRRRAREPGEFAEIGEAAAAKAKAEAEAEAEAEAAAAEKAKAEAKAALESEATAEAEATAKAEAEAAAKAEAEAAAKAEAEAAAKAEAEAAAKVAAAAEAARVDQEQESKTSGAQGFLWESDSDDDIEFVPIANSGFSAEEHVRTEFRKSSVFGEIDRERAAESLRRLGHMVDGELCDEVVETELAGRSTLDQEDFEVFVTSYVSKHMDNMMKKFRAADLDGSGQIDADELSQLLDSDGITPSTGVVAALLEEVAGSATAECDLNQYIRIHSIIQERAGFTRREYKRLRKGFNKFSKSKGMDTLAQSEVRACLAWLGFKTVEDEVQASVNREARDSSNINLPTFLKVVRTYLENEATKIFVALERKDLDQIGTISSAELIDVILDIGYMVTSQDVLTESARRCGVNSKERLTFEDACAILSMIHQCEGLSVAEITECRKSFECFDTDGSGELIGLELEGAIRWMGYMASFENVQALLEEFDLDGTGELDIKCFTKCIARFHQDEMSKVRTAFAEWTTNQTAFALTQPFSGVDVRSIFGVLGHEFDVPERVELSQRVAAEVARPRGEMDIWAIFRTMALFRDGIREEHRQHCGFSIIEVQELRSAFAEYDPENTGSVASKQLMKLLIDLVPDAVNNRHANDSLKTMFAEADADNSGTLEFDEFLSLIRAAKDKASKAKLEKERSAIKDTGFVHAELREFRKVFKTYDHDGSGTLEFDELKQMVAVLIPSVTGHKHSRELAALVNEIDQDGEHTLDFPDFLHLMRKLLDSNWGGVDNAAAG